MQAKAISILGSTGSVGTSTLDVIAFANAQAGEQVYEVEALAAGQDVKTLAEQAITFGAKTRRWTPDIAGRRARSSGNTLS